MFGFQVRFSMEVGAGSRAPPLKIYRWVCLWFVRAGAATTMKILKIHRPVLATPATPNPPKGF